MIEYALWALFMAWIFSLCMAHKNRHIHKYINDDKPMLVSGYGRSQYALRFCKCGHVKVVQELSIDGDWL